MIYIATHGDGPAIFHADQHAASNGTVATGRGHPVIRNLLSRRVAEPRIGGVGILLLQCVDAQDPLDVHAALPEKNEAAMFLGTTLTKNRYRPSNSPASASMSPGTAQPRTGKTMPPRTNNAN